jgi:hypothetical protein
MPETRDTRPYVNEALNCYHEAGHCAAFWHYDVEIDYVTMRPPVGSGHAGQTRLKPRGAIAGVTPLENEMRGAVAGELTWRRMRHAGQFTATELRIWLGGAVEWAIAHPDDEAVNDETGFAKAAIARDDELRDTDPDAPTGLDVSWVGVVREGEELIARLWPAVSAIADELRRREDDVTGSEIVALAKLAMQVAS